MIEYKYDSKLYPGELEYATDLEIYSVRVLASQPQIIVKPNYIGSLQSVWHPKPHKWRPINIEVLENSDNVNGLISIWEIHKSGDKNGYGGPVRKDFNLKFDKDCGKVIYHLKEVLITSMEGQKIVIDSRNIIA